MEEDDDKDFDMDDFDEYDSDEDEDQDTPPPGCKNELFQKVFLFNFLLLMSTGFRITGKESRN